MDTLGIVIPAFRPNISRLVSYIERLQEHLDPATIHVELDDPQPETDIERIGETSAIVKTSSSRRGKGRSIIDGFEALNTDIRMFLDADGATPPESAASVLEPLVAGQADVSTGSRRHPDSVTPVHRTVARRYLGNAFSLLAQILLPVQLYDYQCGAKALTAEAWTTIRTHLYESGFAWDFELLAISDAIGLSIAEVPIKWIDKPGSTVDPIKTMTEFARALLVVRHRALAIQGHPIHTALLQQEAKPIVDD